MCIYLNLFIYVVIDFDNHNYYNRKIYKIYKRKNIDLRKNRYIYNHLKSYNKTGYMRINFYNLMYFLGRIYDTIRKIFKCIINKKNTICLE